MLQKLDTITEIRKNQCGTGLLIEHDGHVLGNKDTIQQIKEDIANHERFVIPDRFVVNAVFQKYGIKNANGRVYPENILKPAVEKYINERVSNRSAVGALDHPESTTLSGHDVTHVITNLQWQGHTLIGEMELHLSPGYRRYGVCSTSGDLVANMLLDDILIGVSSRGVGTVSQRLGVLEVEDDFELISWDVVLEPSTPNAYISRNMQDLMKYVEGDETKNNKPSINEKLLKVKSILI